MAPRWLPLALVVASQLVFYSSSHAAEGSQSVVDTVIVTARKQPEALLRVPESVTVFSSDTIKAQDLRTFTDVALVDEDSGRIGIAKVLTTPHDFGQAVLRGIGQGQWPSQHLGLLVE